jgi:hypothetical protein
MTAMNKVDLENLEKQHQMNLDSQKRFYEEQNHILKKQLEQQIELSKISNQVQSNSNQLGEFPHILI